MRERLIELLRKVDENETITCPRYSNGANLDTCKGCQYDKEDGSCDYAARTADFLLTNGVIVPPCKVGDKVYEIDLPEYGVIVCKITKVLCDSSVVVVTVIDGHGEGSEYYFEFEDFGKTAFRTHEEAEAALKGGEGKCIK